MIPIPSNVVCLKIGISPKFICHCFPHRIVQFQGYFVIYRYTMKLPWYTVPIFLSYTKTDFGTALTIYGIAQLLAVPRLGIVMRISPLLDPNIIVVGIMSQPIHISYVPFYHHPGSCDMSMAYVIYDQSCWCFLEVSINQDTLDGV